MASESRIWKKATAGTHEDTSTPQVIKGAFVVVVFVLMLVPFAGMLWAPTTVTTENRELTELPALYDENGLGNVDILSDLGAYFDDHFAYRNLLVTTNAKLRAALGASATDQVVVGSDGWLYYGGTLPDYLGQSALSYRALANIAHNLSLAQNYVEAHGATFTFTIAPNKNSLDFSHMPYYYLRASDESNIDRLKLFLQDAGIHYLDLFEVLEGEWVSTGRFEYLKLDSHWNNRWALIAADRLLLAADNQALPVSPDAAEWRNDFAGDLQSMLYPEAPQLEQNAYYAGYNDGASMTGSYWRYEEGADVTDDFIQTTAVAADGEAPISQGNLLMFRDSFGNALLPFMASGFKSAAFSKLVPYNLAQMQQLGSSAVVIERAERHLSYLAENPPIMSNPRCKLPEGAREVEADIEVSTEGSYWIVQGRVTGELAPTTALFVEILQPGAELVILDPFWTSQLDEAGVSIDDGGVLVYLPTSALDLSSATVKVLAVG